KGLRGWHGENKNKIREILQSGESVVQTKRKCLNHGLKGLRGWRGENKNKIGEILSSGESVVQTRGKCLNHG
ncbi:MAG: hypothetical protein KF746_17910, partial [Chitinophagaceae bacterium]|nr:hypothetical protein [Chitinophagaceae bacterium]